MQEGLPACSMLTLQAMIRFRTRTRTRTRQLRPARLVMQEGLPACSVLLMPVSMPGKFLARRPRQKE